MSDATILANALLLDKHLARLDWTKDIVAGNIHLYPPTGHMRLFASENVMDCINYCKGYIQCVVHESNKQLRKDVDLTQQALHDKKQEREICWEEGNRG